MENFSGILRLPSESHHAVTAIEATFEGSVSEGEEGICHYCKENVGHKPKTVITDKNVHVLLSDVPSEEKDTIVERKIKKTFFNEERAVCRDDNCIRRFRNELQISAQRKGVDLYF